MEAAAIDGAERRGSASATSCVPALKPIILILTSLSVLWDFRVFTQIYVLQSAGGITRDTNLLGVYAYRISIGANQFDKGAAVAVVMVLITVLDDDVLPPLDDAAGGAVTATARADHAATASPATPQPGARTCWVCSSSSIAAFPVYWMVLTSFRRGVDIQQPTPEFVPVARHARELPQGVRARLLLDRGEEQPDRHAARCWCSRCSSRSSPPSPCRGSSSAVAGRSS